MECTICGLFGWTLTEEAAKQGDLRVLATVLAYNAENRGNESWGVAKVPDGATVKVMKDVGSIRKTCRVRNILALEVIGHTRKATTGAISVPNAHPFEHGKIVGAHNGFIYDHKELNKEYNRNFEVDSQHLIAHISEGISLDSIGGMGTVTYINRDNPQVIFLGRGASSDLAVCYIGSANNPIGVVWGSMAHWVHDAIEMAGFPHHVLASTATRSLYKIDQYKVIEVGEFPLGPSRSRLTQMETGGRNGTGNTCNYPHNQRQHDYLYRGRTYFDNKDYSSEKSHTPQYSEYSRAQLPVLRSLGKSELDELPEHLKKKIQKSEYWRKGKQKKLLKRLGDVMHVRIGAEWLAIMRKMLMG